LKELKAEFGTFDIFTDEKVRQDLKIYSKWPTYPQVRSFSMIFDECFNIIDNIHSFTSKEN